MALAASSGRPQRVAGAVVVVVAFFLSPGPEPEFEPPPDPELEPEPLLDWPGGVVVVPDESPRPWPCPLAGVGVVVTGVVVTGVIVTGVVVTGVVVTGVIVPGGVGEPSCTGCWSAGLVVGLSVRAVSLGDAAGAGVTAVAPVSVAFVGVAGCDGVDGVLVVGVGVVVTGSVVGSVWPRPANVEPVVGFDFTTTCAGVPVACRREPCAAVEPCGAAAVVAAWTGAARRTAASARVPSIAKDGSGVLRRPVSAHAWKRVREQRRALGREDAEAEDGLRERQRQPRRREHRHRQDQRQDERTALVHGSQGPAAAVLLPCQHWPHV